jgi:probable rRNA maturation factor
MNKIGYYNTTDEKVPELKSVRKALKEAIKMEHLDNLEFNIILVDNEYIHKLNRDYRHIDRETDVITFALEDTKDIEDFEARVLGDVYISLDKAHAQAKEYGHSFERELCFLAVHGFFHLLGYDHMNPVDEKVMFGKQDAVLEACGIVR